MPIAIYSLTLGSFCIGLTEFIIMGLLPQVADTFAVGEATAGYLITAYAISVAVGAILFTVLLNKVDKKKAFFLMSLFILGNLICALANNYSVMMAGRIIAALCHGAFFGISSVIATSLVAASKKASALAVMFVGLTIANVLGVPLGTFVGQAFGWKATFWVITVLGIIAFVALVTLIPQEVSNRVTRENRTENPWSDFVIFKDQQVWLSILVTIFGNGGLFAAFTYIAYTLTEVSHFSEGTVPWLLILFGMELFVGNMLGGKYADKNLSMALLVILFGFMVVLFVFSLIAGNKALTVIFMFLMGAFGFAMVPCLQLRIMNYAAKALVLAAGTNIAAFNVGNAMGSFLGGKVLDWGFGYTSPLWMGTLITLAGICIFIYATKFAEDGELVVD